MSNVINVLASRATGLRRETSIIANNISNANTSGFRGEKLLFVEYLAKAGRSRQLSQTYDIGTARSLDPGSLTTTGNPLDLAMSSEGYFVLETDFGVRYTRDGHFALDPLNRIVSSDGSFLTGDDGAITLPPGTTNFEVAGDGTVSDGIEVLGKVRVVGFDDERVLKHEGNNRFIAPDDAFPFRVGQPQIVQGVIEGSNVEPILELTRMLDVARSYESVQRAIANEHERISKAITALGRIA